MAKPKNPIVRNYGRRPSVIGDEGDYHEMMKTPPRKALLDQRLEPKSQFDKPYLQDDYAEMEYEQPAPPGLTSVSTPDLDWPEVPSSPVPDLPPPGEGGKLCGLVCFSPLYCDDPVECHIAVIQGYTTEDIYTHPGLFHATINGAPVNIKIEGGIRPIKIYPPAIRSPRCWGVYPDDPKDLVSLRIIGKDKSGNIILSCEENIDVFCQPGNKCGCNCEDLPEGAFAFDADSTTDTIGPNSSTTIYFTGGCPPYKFFIPYALGYYFDVNHTITELTITDPYSEDNNSINLFCLDGVAEVNFDCEALVTGLDKCSGYSDYPAWKSGVNYTGGKTVVYDDRYECLEDHTSSGNFYEDYDAGYWFKNTFGDDFVKTITIYNTACCCDDLPFGALEFDNDSTPDTVVAGSSIDIYVTGGCGPFVFSTDSVGYSFPSHNYSSWATETDYVYEDVVEPPTYLDWTTSTLYEVGDTVSNSGVYVCLVEHTSGDFEDDVTSGYWYSYGVLAPYYICIGDHTSTDFIDDIEAWYPLQENDHWTLDRVDTLSCDTGVCGDPGGYAANALVSIKDICDTVVTANIRNTSGHWDFFIGSSNSPDPIRASGYVYIDNMRVYIGWGEGGTIPVNANSCAQEYPVPLTSLFSPSLTGPGYLPQEMVNHSNNPDRTWEEYATWLGEQGDIVAAGLVLDWCRWAGTSICYFMFQDNPCTVGNSNKRLARSWSVYEWVC